MVHNTQGHHLHNNNLSTQHLQQEHVCSYSQHSVSQSDKLPMPMLTPGQHQKLRKMLDTTTINGTSEAINMAGNLFLNYRESLKWIVDTGATNHMIGDHKHLHHEGLIENAGQVQLPTEESAQVSDIGNCHLGGGDVLRKVLCVPTFKFNLMSESQVTKDLNCSATFFPQCCVFQDLLSGKVRAIGKEEDGLYTLCSFLGNKSAGLQKCLAITKGANLLLGIKGFAMCQ